MALQQLRSSGVTIIELMISMAIFALLTTIIIVAFIGGRQEQDLNGAAQQLAADLRQLQGYAFTGEQLERCSGPSGPGLHYGATCTRSTSVTDCGGAGLCGLVPSGGYGLVLATCATGCSYPIFADLGDGNDPNAPNGTYDPSGPTVTVPDVQLRSVSLPRNVGIEQVAIQGVSVPLTNASLTFTPPKGTLMTTPSGSTISICLRHAKSGHRRAVRVQRASGQISATMVESCPTLP